MSSMLSCQRRAPPTDKSSPAGEADSREQRPPGCWSESCFAKNRLIGSHQRTHPANTKMQNAQSNSHEHRTNTNRLNNQRNRRPSSSLLPSGSAFRLNVQCRNVYCPLPHLFIEATLVYSVCLLDCILL
jgi:hypothetical protein